MIKHIPATAKEHHCAWTYCGRRVLWTRCIDPGRDCIEEATCKACHRSDDRRVRESMCGKQTDFQRCTFLPGHSGPCEGMS